MSQLINVTDLLQTDDDDAALERYLVSMMRDLAEKLDRALSNYEVRLICQSRADYLEFIEREPGTEEKN